MALCINNVNTTNPVVYCTETDSYNEYEMKYLIQSARAYGIQLNILGMGCKFTFPGRFSRMLCYLLSLPKTYNPLIVFMDGYDTFFIKDPSTFLEEFKKLNSDIVFSAEALHSHQLACEREHWDKVAPPNCFYKYINCGTFCGYKDALIDFYTNLLDLSQDSNFKKDYDPHNGFDQWAIGHYLVNNWGKYKFSLDYECKLFYVTCKDWDTIETAVTDDFIVSKTGNKPFICHSTWKSRYGNVLNIVYKKATMTDDKLQKASGYQLINKSFTWGDSYIRFLENGKMTFGSLPGWYIVSSNPNVIDADFGGYRHLLIFNDDFTSYKSYRYVDTDKQSGVLCK